MKRVIIYIDGFNLYFGMKSMYNNTRWLDIRSLSEKIVPSDDVLMEVKYFTSMVSNDYGKEKRQRTYISALETTNISIIYGHYKTKPKSCHKCGFTWSQNEEKMTDVNIATNMLVDAMGNKFDKAILISGDSDLVPPINAVLTNFPKKEVIIAFPPNRFNHSVKVAATNHFIIGRQKLTKSQFPNEIMVENGTKISKPQSW